MRTNSIFIAHVAEAIGSPLGGGRGWRSGLPRIYPWPRCGTRTGHGLGNSHRRSPVPDADAAARLFHREFGARWRQDVATALELRDVLIERGAADVQEPGDRRDGGVGLRRQCLGVSDLFGCHGRKPAEPLASGPCGVESFRFSTSSPEPRPNRRVFRFQATETAQLQATDVPLMTAVHITRALRLRR